MDNSGQKTEVAIQFQTFLYIAKRELQVLKTRILVEVILLDVKIDIMENTLSLEAYIETLYQKALYNVRENIEMLFIQAKSKTSASLTKELDEKLIEDYLKKRGYTMNYVLGKRVMVKDFTCVFLNKNTVEVWHDKSKHNKPVFIKDSLLTGLPITLDYMERVLRCNIVYAKRKCNSKKS